MQHVTLGDSPKVHLATTDVTRKTIAGTLCGKGGEVEPAVLGEDDKLCAGCDKAAKKQNP